ncbi:MAG TPA: YggS family pyridoxal phosphate-dependent enzyme [Chitinophagales bacterium]|nr:YggS family pyridoxal phosphate-dependent enzyme [Chitinophagales bacterium]HMX59552.1 YggS family pyridoxal phosphate-dependent enzyme [Chitinophagales bacterium]HMY23654.1 YggS family pyridoxal phosphate-dependent enzyme [Chitinophagales bacterium]HMZ33013.1 YggS family pyridoxal phosphate-dependent enzyme [Chitinophagales bacterium]HNA38761.1 YggS family pyridoxal phosphate-dependent enzyme [Chitinophagales bacterium]
MNNIVSNIQAIQNRINEACEKANRNPNEVKLLLATKTVSAENIKHAIEAGACIIGENKIQEIKEKYESLKSVVHEKHFIGHLQSNKIKEILRYEVSCLQSLDRLDLAEKLQQRLATENKELDVYIQVNTSGEESKFGVAPNDAITLVKSVATLKNIHIKGLMTIGLFSAEHNKVRQCFALLKSIQQSIIRENIEGVEMKELSMGMSGDLEIAIEEGSTMIRVGTAIFGNRIYPDSYYWNESKAVN